jgi:predicted small secreted protein
MKRSIALILAVLLIVSLFAGCGGASGPEGKYVAKTINGQTVEDYFKSVLEEEDVGMTLEEFLEMVGLKSLDDYMTIELKSGGTAVVTVAMEDEVSTGTWKQSGNTITITVDGEDEVFTLNGKQLSATLGDGSYVFEKK